MHLRKFSVPFSVSTRVGRIFSHSGTVKIASLERMSWETSCKCNYSWTETTTSCEYVFFCGLWNESFCSLIILPLDENFDIKYFFMMMIRTKEIAKESSVYGAQFKRMCIAVIFCILTMHCVSFVVLSPSLRRFHEKRPHQEGKMSSLERAENWEVEPPSSPATPPSYRQFVKYWWQLSTLW